MRLVFFDVDGTLSSPCYLVEGKLQIGMTDAQWKEFCPVNGDKSYANCKPVPQIKAYAKAAKESGAMLFALTTSASQAETRAKEVFVHENYPGLFTEVYGVAHDADKGPFILEKAKEYGLEPKDCELVEDTYRILLQTLLVGIKSTHITTILTGMTDQME